MGNGAHGKLSNASGPALRNLSIQAFQKFNWRLSTVLKPVPGCSLRAAQAPSDKGRVCASSSPDIAAGLVSDKNVQKGSPAPRKQASVSSIWENQ